MAIVVDPVTRQASNQMNQLALQIIAGKQAQRLENERNDIDAAYQATGAELKAMIDDGRIVNMLQGDPDQQQQAMDTIGAHIDALATRTGKKLTPEERTRQVQLFANKFDWRNMTAEEKARWALTHPDMPLPPDAPATPPGAPAPSPNQPSSGSVPISGSGTSTTESAPTTGADSTNLTVQIKGKPVVTVDKGALLMRMKDKYKAEGKMFPMSDAVFMQRISTTEFGVGNHPGATGSAALGPDFERILATSVDELTTYSKAPEQVPTEDRNPWRVKTPAQPPVQAQTAFPAYKSGSPEAIQYAKSLDDKQSDVLIKKMEEAGKLTPRTRTLKEKQDIIVGNMGTLGILMSGGILAPVGPPSKISSTPAIAEESKKKASELGFDETIPKIAQSTAKSLEVNSEKRKGIFQRIKDGTATIRDKVELKRDTRKAQAVWKSVQVSPTFKKASAEEKKYWSEFIDNASPEELAGAGMVKPGEIKAESERTRANLAIAQAQMAVGKLQAQAQSNAAWTQMVVQAGKDAAELVNKVYTTTKGDAKAIKEARLDPTVNAAFLTAGETYGLTPAKMEEAVKAGWFGKITMIPIDFKGYDTVQERLGSLMQQGSAGSRSAAQSYIDAVKGIKP